MKRRTLGMGAQRLVMFILFLFLILFILWISGLIGLETERAEETQTFELKGKLEIANNCGDEVYTIPDQAFVRAAFEAISTTGGHLTSEEIQKVDLSVINSRRHKKGSYSLVYTVPDKSNYTNYHWKEIEVVTSDGANLAGPSDVSEDRICKQMNPCPESDPPVTCQNQQNYNEQEATLESPVQTFNILVDCACSS